MCGSTGHDCHNFPHTKAEWDGDGNYGGKTDAVNDPVLLEDEWYPIAKDYEDVVPGNNNNKHLYKSDVQGDPSSHDDEWSPPRPIHKSILPTQEELFSLIYIVFYLETMGLSRSKFSLLIRLQ